MFTIGNVLNIFMEHDFRHIKLFIILSHNVLLSSSTNIAVLIMTLLQGHRYECPNYMRHMIKGMFSMLI